MKKILFCFVVVMSSLGMADSQETVSVGVAVEYNTVHTTITGGPNSKANQIYDALVNEAQNTTSTVGALRMNFGGTSCVKYFNTTNYRCDIVTQIATPQPYGSGYVYGGYGYPIAPSAPGQAIPSK